MVFLYNEKVLDSKDFGTDSKSISIVIRLKEKGTRKKLIPYPFSILKILINNFLPLRCQC